MRRVVADLVILCVLWAARLLGRQPRFSAPQGLDERAAWALARAKDLTEGATNEGHVLVVLASMPGEHIRILRREHRQVAAACRRELGLVRDRDRITLALDYPSLLCRRLERRIQQRRLIHRWPYLAMRSCGLLWAVTVFFLDTAGTVCLYIFLWPALLLANGVRTITAHTLGLRVAIRRFHEIPGGELEVLGEDLTSDRRLAIAVLIPRLVCFGICVTTVTLVLWQMSALGVQPLPITFARHDIIEGHILLASLVAPTLILFDALITHGIAGGIGLLAGLGAGVLAVPSVREVELIQLAGGHDLGKGSRALRIIVAPLVLITALFALAEAILPFKGGPLYLTTYGAPIILALAAAVPIVAVLGP
jgi:hypothetical protein